MFEFDIVPPQPSARLPRPTEEQTAENERRKAHEDSIRSAYTSTFATPESARSFATATDMDADKTVRLLTESRGNHTLIENLLKGLSPEDRDRAMGLMLAASEKDRRDIPMEVVTDRLAIPYMESPLYYDYIINPRVENEGLAPFVKTFLKDMPSAEAERYRANPQQWVKWVGKNIKNDGKWNPAGIRTRPEGVWRDRIADPISRDIFFVASARAMGIPARKDQVTGKTQWHNGSEWIDADFSTGNSDKVSVTPSGKINYTFTPAGRIQDPVYYSQFSISKIENGIPRVLDFDENITLSGINATHPVLDTGQYILTSGQRMADGSVLARSHIFTVGENESKEVPLVIRQDEQGLQVVGNFNSENRYTGSDGKEQSLLSTTGRGYYTLIYAKPNHEPTAHVLNDISAMADKFEADGRKIMLLYGDSAQLRRAQLDRFPDLPDNVVAGHDTDDRMLNEITENLSLTEGDLPVVIVADTFNRVVFVSQGYTIGIGEKLLDVLEKVKN